MEDVSLILNALNTRSGMVHVVDPLLVLQVHSGMETDVLMISLIVQLELTGMVPLVSQVQTDVLKELDGMDLCA